MIRHALTYMKAYLGKYIKNEKGQTMVEYGLIIGLIAVALIAVFVVFNPAVTDMYEQIIEGIKEKVPAPTP